MAPHRNLLPWVTTGGLLLLALGAALGSAMTAPTSTSATVPAKTPTTTVPAASCPAPAGSPSVTLEDTAPIPAITVSVNTTLVAVVPPWPGERATDIDVVNPAILSPTCTVLLPDGGRRTLLYASRAGRTLVTATVAPPTQAMMPAWQATVTVTGTNPPPPAGTISSVIDLPSTTLVAGTTDSGALVVTNHSDRTINLTTGCEPFWAVGLQSPSMPFHPVWPALCSLAPFLLAPGENQLAFQLDVPPSLPPGSYQAVLVSQSPALGAPPVDVAVVAASSPTPSTTTAS